MYDLILIKRFAQFCLVGGGGVFVDMAVLFLLADPRTLGWPVVVSKIIAAEVAMINNFAWNETWTFGDRHPEAGGIKACAVRLLKFNLICSAGIAIAVTVLHLLHSRMGINLYAANFMAIVTATFWNFFMSNKFAWAKNP